MFLAIIIVPSRFQDSDTLLTEMIAKAVTKMSNKTAIIHHHHLPASPKLLRFQIIIYFTWITC